MTTPSLPTMLAEQSAICPVLVGRGVSLGTARHLLQRARGGRGGALLVSGEAGIGKSRLVRATVDEARSAGYIVLEGSCFEADRTLPYAPLLDLVRTLAATSSPSLAAHYFAPAIPELLALFPELGAVFSDAVPSVSLDPEQDRRRLFNAVAQAIHALAQVQPLLLVFEDVHWSDDATLDLVLHLARGIGSRSTILALTYRSDEVGPRLDRLLADLDRARVSAELPLHRLALPEVSAMLRAIFGSQGDFDDAFLTTLHATTEGNPFFVEEVLKALVVSGDLAPAANGRWRARALEHVRVPRTAVEAVRRRLAGLSADARETASIAAVAGRRFDFTLLQSLTPHDEREVLALVKELVAAQLVVEESADRFAFRHALTREAIRGELLTRERMALHRQVAAALERQHAGALGPVIDALSYHSFEAGEWESARRYAMSAAEHALALSAPREALEHLDRAFNATARTGRAVDPAFHLARGRAYETLGDFQSAHDDFTAVLGAARSGGLREMEWQALHALGMLWSARDYERAGGYRRAALDVARALADPSRIARSLNRVGNWHVNLENPGEGLPYHEEALGIFEQLGDQRGVAETVDLIAMAHLIGGNVSDAAPAYERAIELFTALNDRRGLANALTVLPLCGPSHYGSSLSVCSSPSMSDALSTERAVRLAREIGWRAGEAFALYCLADCLFWRGALDRALPMVRESLAIANEIEHFEWQCGAHRVLGAIALDLCSPAFALPHLQVSYDIARRLGSRTWTRWAAAPLAIALARSGAHEQADALFAEVARVVPRNREEPDVPELCDLTLGERYLWLARAELALARDDAAHALAIVEARLGVEQVETQTARLGAPRLNFVRGQALALLGRDDDALSALRVAAIEARAQDARPLLWRIDASVGAIHLAAPRRREARLAFDSARAIASDLESLIDDESLRTAFRAGVDALAPAAPAPSPGRVARAAHGGLTRRERDVAQLVAQGKSNRAIARALGIGERTVEGHVASALGKLAFSSRAQLAGWAVEQGLAHPSGTRSAP